MTVLPLHNNSSKIDVPIRADSDALFSELREFDLTFGIIFSLSQASRNDSESEPVSAFKNNPASFNMVQISSKHNCISKRHDVALLVGWMPT
jgi:hypothetical protein